jgi:transglutaminase-like putative cysteine protease
MKLNIQHTTKHIYDKPVSFSNHALFLRPLDSHLRYVSRFAVQTTPPSSQRWVRDAHGNLVLVCNFGLEESRELSFHTTTEIEIQEDNPFDFILESYATSYPFSYREPDLAALLPFKRSQPAVGAGKVLDWFYKVVPNPVQHSDVVRFLSDLNEAISREITYLRRDEEGIQDPDTTLRLLSGSCRDMAQLFIAIVRQLGFAARFCSGYLYDPPVGEGAAHVFNRAVGSMHAWTEVYLPGAGWKGFDPTNGILANGFFIPCAVSHEPKCVDPIQGSYFANESVASTMKVSLEIERIEG